MGEYALGQPVLRSEDPRLLRGGGRYVDDFVLPRMVHGWVLRSPHAHAEITTIDTEAARAAPGVLAVLTGADWAASGLGDLPRGGGFKMRDGAPMFVPSYPALVRSRVRRVGDYVAFVVAETLAQAKDAAERIEVDYHGLPSVTDTAAAARPGAPAVWDDCPDNICFVHRDGDAPAVERAIAAAAHVIEHRFVINRVSANTIEPRGCLAHYDAADDLYTIYTTLQQGHPYRASLAGGVLKVPESHVRVVAGDIGGSFGMKSEIYPEVALSLWTSKLTGRPVKWIAERTESLLSDAHGRDNVTEAALALDADGMFLALRVRTLFNLGAYLMATGPFPGVVNLGTLAGVYTTPAISVDVTGLFSNTNPTRPYRGAGRPEAAYVTERIIDIAAGRLGIDPVELRRRNTISPAAMPFKTGLTFTYDCGAFEANMDLALDLSGHGGFAERRRAAAARGRLRGIGISNTIERAAAGGFEGAELRFDRTGTATILAGSITQGQGHETVFKQIVCDRLGLVPEEVRYVWGDTDKVAFGHGTGGSRTATLGGSAVSMATQKVIDKATLVAAHLLEAAAEDVGFEDGVFTIAGTDRRIAIKEVARAAADPAKIPAGMEPGLTGSAVYTASVMNFPNGCHVCELEIDPETGNLEVEAYSVVDDVGTVMNPLLLKGQIQGGVAQGLGQALFEDIRYEDGSGQLVTGSFMDYAMPRAEDMSMIEVKSNPVPTRTNPLGVKGAGEAGNVGALPAVANAVVDALSPLGIDHIEMPATTERIWRAIRNARADS